MVSLLKRLRRLARLGRNRLAIVTGLKAQYVNAPPLKARGDMTSFTPASWPTIQRSAEIFRWGGGCCG